MMIVRASESELELENFAPGRLFGPTINQSINSNLPL